MAAKLQVVAAEPFKVETTVPLPSGAGPRGLTNGAIRALSVAAVGASVFLPDVTSYTAQQAAWRLGGKGWVTIRKVDGGFRVWKIAEPKLRA